MSTLHNLDTITNKRLALFFILIGLFFSVDYFLGVSIVYKLWPILLLNLGIGLIGIFTKLNKKEPLFLVVGEYLVLFSFLALYCNFTSWRLLAQMWPLFILFFGCVMITQFFFHKRNRLALFLGMVFSFLSIFFFLVFSVSGQYWWTIFIFIGLSILLSGMSK